MATHRDGAKITLAGGGKFQVPDTPTILYIEGDGTGPDIWQATRPVLEKRQWPRLTGNSRRIFSEGDVTGEEGCKMRPQLFTGGNPDGPPGIPGGPQRTPHHPHRRGVPVPERHSTAGPGPVCLHPAGALL